jgi:polyribonucleotide nucleotidyltransferase
MATNFVSNPATLVSIGQQVTVRVVEIDEQGRINLSMLFGEDAKKKTIEKKQPRQFERRFDRPRRRF